MPQSIPELEPLETWGLNDLLLWAASRRLSCGMERSARLQYGNFETRRALFSFSLSDIGRDAVSEIIAICRSMHAPERLLQGIVRFFTAAAFVHFGFECAGTVMIGKCYLELPPPDPESAPVSGRLQFLGFKWSMNDSSVAVVTRYRLLQIPHWEDAASLMLANTGALLKPAMDNLLHVVCHSVATGPGSVPMLEIEEEGSDRRSYDLNVYDRNISLFNVTEALQQAAIILDANPESAFRWLNSNAAAQVGHIATGLGRDQQSFLTVYYGLP